MNDIHKTHCWAWDRIYVKANGRIPCWCDAGEPYTIVNRKINECDFIRDIYNSPQMREMRLSFIRHNKKYIKECDNCCCLLTKDKGDHHRFVESDNNNSLISKHSKAKKFLDKWVLKGYDDGYINHISEMQIEPSFPCNLRCPGCLQGRHPNPLSTESAPYQLPLEWYKRIIDSVVYNDTKLKRIAFVGRGEPTLHKDFPAMIEYTKTNTPNVKMSMDTNANQEYKPAYDYLDFINCSIDGSDQESYSNYRIGGNFDKAVEFMRCGASSNKTRIKWKYILFDTNDSDDNLNKAQEIAKVLNISELLFIITHTGGGKNNPSSRFKSLEHIINYINCNKIFDATNASYAT